MNLEWLDREFSSPRTALRVCPVRPAEGWRYEEADGRTRTGIGSSWIGYSGFFRLWMILILAAGVTKLAPAEIVDRVAAVVENEVVTLSDLRWLINYQGQKVPEDAAEQRRFYEEMLQQVVDQKLIAAEALRTPGITITSQDVEQRVENYRGQFASEAAFEEQLSQMEMSLADLRELIYRQLAVLYFVKVRFEPFIIVLPDQIQQYYDQVLLPELQRNQQAAPLLELVEEQIRQILTLERTNQEIDNWVRNTRGKARLQILLFRNPPQAPNLPVEFLGQVELQALEISPR